MKKEIKNKINFLKFFLTSWRNWDFAPIQWIKVLEYLSIKKKKFERCQLKKIKSKWTSETVQFKIKAVVLSPGNAIPRSTILEGPSLATYFGPNSSWKIHGLIEFPFFIGPWANSPIQGGPFITPHLVASIEPLLQNIRETDSLCYSFPSILLCFNVNKYYCLRMVTPFTKKKKRMVTPPQQKKKKMVLLAKYKV